ncbi:MAG: hypothetical protein ACE5GC_01155 [Acidimicrobiia bacterium]
MAAVLVAVFLLLVVLATGLAFAWQGSSGAPDAAVVYGVEDAIEYIYPRLETDAAQALTRTEVRRILEWEVEYLQNRARRSGEPAVVGGINAARFAQQRLIAAGRPYDGAVILEVLEIQAEYLAAIGAVGRPVTGSERSDVLEGSGEVEEDA